MTEKQAEQPDRRTPSEPEPERAPDPSPPIRDGRSPARGESKDRRLVERSETK